jgi:hypothetical protein
LGSNTNYEALTATSTSAKHYSNGRPGETDIPECLSLETFLKRNVVIGAKQLECCACRKSVVSDQNKFAESVYFVSGRSTTLKWEWVKVVTGQDSWCNRGKTKQKRIEFSELFTMLLRRAGSAQTWHMMLISRI